MKSPAPTTIASLDVDIAWHRQQVDVCTDALATVSGEMPSPSLDTERRIIIEAIGRYQATLEHLLRLKATIIRGASSA